MYKVTRRVALAATLALFAQSALPQVVVFPYRTGKGEFVTAICSSAVQVVAPADANENILATCTIPGGAMGLNGQLRIMAGWSANNNVNAKTIRIRFGGIGGTVYSALALTSLQSGFDMRVIANRGAANSQVGAQSGGTPISTSGNALTTSAVNTSVDTTLVFTCQKAVGADTCALDFYNVELYNN